MSINDKLNSLNSELNRINSAKAAIASAITAKGVAVPDGAKIESYPALVEQIQTASTGDEIPVALLLEGNPFGFDGYFYRNRMAHFGGDNDVFYHDEARNNDEYNRAEILIYKDNSGFWYFNVNFEYSNVAASDNYYVYEANYASKLSGSYNSIDDVIKAYKDRPLTLNFSNSGTDFTSPPQYGAPEYVSFTLRVGMTANFTTLIADNPNATPTFPPQKPGLGAETITVSGFGMTLQRYNTTYQLSSDGKYWKADVTSSNVLELRIKHGKHPGNSQQCWIFGDDTGTMQAFIYSTNTDPQSILGTQSCVDASNTNYTLTITSGATSVEATGLLEVITSPTLTPPTGAQWSIDGVTWNNFGLRISVTVGTYTVQFKDVSGYTTPASQTATVTEGQVTSITVGEYVASGGESGGGSSSGPALRLTSSSVANGCAQVYNLTSGDPSSTPTAGSNSLVFTGVTDTSWTIVIEYEAEFSSFSFLAKQNGNTMYAYALRDYTWQNLADAVAQIQPGNWMDNNTGNYLDITLTVEESGSGGESGGGSSGTGASITIAGTDYPVYNQQYTYDATASDITPEDVLNLTSGNAVFMGAGDIDRRVIMYYSDFLGTARIYLAIQYYDTSTSNWQRMYFGYTENITTVADTINRVSNWKNNDASSVYGITATYSA